MLIPRYSIRWLLGLTTFAAVVSLVLASAVRGRAWAIGVSAGLWSLVVVFIAYVAAFSAAWLVAQVIAAMQQRPHGGGGSPFAAKELTVGAQGSMAREPTVDTPPPLTG